MEKIDLKSLNLEEMTRELKEIGLPGFRAKQIYQWIHQKQVSSYEEMSNIPLKLREILEEEYPLMKLNMIQVQE